MAKKFQRKTMILVDYPSNIPSSGQCPYPSLSLSHLSPHSSSSIDRLKMEMIEDIFALKAQLKNVRIYTKSQTNDSLRSF